MFVPVAAKHVTLRYGLMQYVYDAVVPRSGTVQWFGQGYVITRVRGRIHFQATSEHGMDPAPHGLWAGGSSVPGHVFSNMAPCCIRVCNQEGRGRERVFTHIHTLTHAHAH